MRSMSMSLQNDIHYPFEQLEEVSEEDDFQHKGSFHETYVNILK